MRLWHVDLIKYLPDSQLKAQWRELNCIYTQNVQHILINYVYKYPKGMLQYYSDIVIKEMNKRGFGVKSIGNYAIYFKETSPIQIDYPEHNNEYLMICYYNLYEKFLRGQKDFTTEVYNKLRDFVLRKTMPGYGNDIYKE